MFYSFVHIRKDTIKILLRARQMLPFEKKNKIKKAKRTEHF